MDNSQYVDLILLKAINYAIGFFDQFADVFSFILGYFTTRKWLSGDLLRAMSDPIYHSSGVSRGISDHQQSWGYEEGPSKGPGPCSAGGR